MNDEIFRPIPGYEDLYAISEYGRIKHLKFNRLKKSTITKRGQEIIVLFKEGQPTPYTVSSLLNLTWRNTPIRKNVGSSFAHRRQLKCEETGQIFDSYKQCSKELNLPYRQMCKAISSNSEYKGYHLTRID